MTENKTFVQNMMNDDAVPMGYYRVLREIQDQAPEGTIIQAEGANTMDISRSVLMHKNPRERIDAATFGTMGVGLAQAIAAQVVHPDRKVICVEATRPWLLGHGGRDRMSLPPPDCLRDH